jgi:hypothetical protein
MEQEVYTLIAKRYPPGDSWKLIDDKVIHKSSNRSIRGILSKNSNGL